MRARTDHSIIKTVRVRGVLPFYLFTLLLLSSCSLTKDIPDDDQLFRGLKEIVYIDEQDNQQPESKALEDQKVTMKEEIEAALATIPNGSLFFSSYYAAPWSWRLWVYIVDYFAVGRFGGRADLPENLGGAFREVFMVVAVLQNGFHHMAVRCLGYLRAFGHVHLDVCPEKVRI